MAIIGTFTQRDAQFIGTVRTLILNEEITLIPIEKNSEAAPANRAVAGQIELAARLVKMAEGWRLLWSR